MLVMMALADFGNDNGGSIYPSVRRVANKSRLSVSQCRRVIHRLIDQGLVEVVGNHTGGGTNSRQYRIRIDRLTSLPKLYDPKSYPRGGGTGATPNDSDGTSADATPLAVSPSATATPNEPTSPSVDATPTTSSTGAGATPTPSADERASAGARGGADAPEGWRPCALGVAPVRDRGGAHASLTVNNRQEPLGTVSKEKRAKAARRTQLDITLESDEWPKWRQWCHERHGAIDPEKTLTAFCDHYQSPNCKNPRMKDWYSAWQKWLDRGWHPIFKEGIEPGIQPPKRWLTRAEQLDQQHAETNAYFENEGRTIDGDITEIPADEVLNNAN